MKRAFEQNRFFVVIFIILFVGSFTNLSLFATDRFPRPEFESEYTQPQPTMPEAHPIFWEYFDVAILLFALIMASYLSLKKRSRNGMVILMIFSLLYFGFFREGCICPVGSLQNVVLAFFDSSYVLPLSVLLFFTLPLIFALFFGRTFCAAVCPLGAAQDVVLLKPVKLPKWLVQILSLIPYLYLGLVVLLVIIGAGFYICRLDPFVTFFRFTGSFQMVIYSLSFIALSIFIARPYCRFLCPYGVLLGWMSHLSKWHLKITPDECNQCRLCEESCPFDLIAKPTPPVKNINRSRERKQFVLLLVLMPLWIFISGWSTSRLYIPLSGLHPTILLSEQIMSENLDKDLETTLESRTFQQSGTSQKELIEEALRIRMNVKFGGWILGGFFGFIIGWKLLMLTIRKKQINYEPIRSECFSCARCCSYCPEDPTCSSKNDSLNSEH